MDRKMLKIKEEPPSPENVSNEIIRGSELSEMLNFIKQEPQIAESVEVSIKRENTGNDTHLENVTTMEELSAEMIAQLKKKREMHLKAKLKPDPVTEESTNLLSVIEDEKKTKYDIKVWQTRCNFMESRNTDFGDVLEVGSNLRREILGKLPVENSKFNTQQPAAPKAPLVTRYDRYDQEVFADSNDFNIDAGMSFVSKSKNIFEQVIVPPPPVAKEKSPPLPKKRTSRTPIIIVPSTANMSGSLISMYNVRDILENLSFVTVEENKSKGTKRETDFLIHRKRGDLTVSYRVLDSVARLNEDQWDRIVAVFAMGPLWQFKGWKWDGNPAEIFARIPGFYIYYEDMRIDPNVAGWNVTKLAIARDKRHLDRARIMRFWDIVERHISKNKPQLRG